MRRILRQWSSWKRARPRVWFVVELVVLLLVNWGRWMKPFIAVEVVQKGWGRTFREGMGR